MLKSLVHCFHVRAGRRARARRSLSLWFVLGVSTGFFQDLPARAAFGERITVSGTEFRAGTNRIWINGANTPWHVWNEFGGKFNEAWWDHHFELMHENGINASRVWIACDGGGGINIDSNGHVTGCTPKFWADLDALLRIAERHQVYIMATLISFDHFSEGKAHYQGWRKMITNTANIDSMVTNYVVPVVQRYRDDPWLWCVDLCNEPDWISENARCGKISWDWIQTYFARAALGVHTHSRALVTVGIAMGPKYRVGHAANEHFERCGSRSQGRRRSERRSRFHRYPPLQLDDPGLGRPVLYVAGRLRTARKKTHDHRGMPRQRDRAPFGDGGLRKRV